MIVKSPGGSTFPYYYKGGEIHGLKYGSFYSEEERLFAVMDAEADFIRKRPAQRLRAWVDFYETVLSDEVLLHFAHNILSFQDQLIKLAVAGFSSGDRARLKRLMKKEGLAFMVPVRFFDDPEDAKTWLVADME